MLAAHRVEMHTAPAVGAERHCWYSPHNPTCVGNTAARTSQLSRIAGPPPHKRDENFVLREARKPPIDGLLWGQSGGHQPIFVVLPIKPKANQYRTHCAPLGTDIPGQRKNARMHTRLDMSAFGSMTSLHGLASTDFMNGLGGYHRVGGTGKAGRVRFASTSL
jgi:hypothetical protein